MIDIAHVSEVRDFSPRAALIHTKMITLTRQTFMMSQRSFMQIIITIWIPKRETMTGWMKMFLARGAAGPAYIIDLSRRTHLMKITTPKTLKPSHSS